MRSLLFPIFDCTALFRPSIFTVNTHSSISIVPLFALDSLLEVYFKIDYSPSGQFIVLWCIKLKFSCTIPFDESVIDLAIKLRFSHTLSLVSHAVVTVDWSGKMGTIVQVGTIAKSDISSTRCVEMEGD